MSYATKPFDISRMPPGIPFIVSNEAAERFSYYGMRAILVIYMTEYLRNSSGELAVMTDTEARGYFHLFSFSVYIFPILGALVADALLGKYLTIVSVSLVYCAGHAALALGDTGLGAGLGIEPKQWLAIGLTLIAIGSGGIKPCVSAHVGDQFGSSNSHLLPRVFGWFYFSINLGAFASQLLIPVLLERVGPSVAFGVPGLLMGIATLVFWSGRNKFVHIPPAGLSFVKEVLSGEGLRALGRLASVYVFVAVFWSLFDQTGSAWVLQAKRMDRNFLGVEWLPSQVQAINPLLILGFIPLFTYVLYPAIERVFPLTALRKISIGLFLAVPSFLLSAWIENRLAAGEAVNVGWQLLAFVVITAAEVLVSITCLEFSYTQAPNRMKSFVMALFLASVSLGNGFTSAFNFLILKDGASRLSETQYYLFFSGTMAAAAFGFVVVARRFEVRSYVQDSGALEPTSQGPAPK
jgi:POT family proton-dependent oligopeptide transporter